MDLGQLISGVKPEEAVGGVMPAGNYNVMMEEVTGYDTAGGGKAIKLKMRVFGEKYNNACLFDNVNVAHPTSVQAVEIGKARLARLAEIFQSTNTDHWLNKAATLYVSVKKNKDTNQDENRISSYSPYSNGGLGTTPNNNQHTQAQNLPNQGAAQGVKVTSDDIPW